MMNISVFASGSGTNLSAIIRAVRNKKLNVNIGLVVVDNPKAKAKARAKRAGIKTLLIQANKFSSRAGFEQEISRHLKENNIDLIVLAGFMRILGPDFIDEYKNKIINIHPSLLPSFKGAHGIRDAFDYGVKVTGVTVHFVDARMDHGPIIMQKQVEIKENDTLKSVEEKIHKLEHKIYPQVIKLISQRRLVFEGRKVLLKGSTA